MNQGLPKFLSAMGFVKHHDLEQPMETYRAHSTPTWWGGRPPSSTRRLRLVGVEMVEPKPLARTNCNLTGVQTTESTNFHKMYENVFQEELKTMTPDIRRTLFRGCSTPRNSGDDTSTLCGSEIQPEILTDSYLRVRLLDTEANQPLFLRAQRVRPESTKSLKEIRDPYYELRGSSPRDRFLPFDGILQNSECVSMTLILPSDYDQSGPNFYFADVGLAASAITWASKKFSIVEPDAQQYWFCYLMMMVLSLSLNCEIIEHGLDDTRGKVKVCGTGHWGQTQRRIRELETNLERNWGRADCAAKSLSDDELCKGGEGI
ncbi:hypothetical protein CPB83DRAFT_897801 [Crepidotus variabilis]|uniref:Uncharacterized protein n=1 Tax=Crepidotus variabilis TaxID=179855 RepID=A0A9P6E8K7_9AGAR|nr:hypothetical protein CPB83DRAFT_897801 [Crepidotus variabilis]